MKWTIQYGNLTAHTTKIAMALEYNSEYDFINLLISMVENYRCLYDKSDAFYYNKIKKSEVWAIIAEATNKNVTECKNKWKLLRERFGKELKKKEMPSNSGLIKEEEWQYFQNMIFIKDSIKPRRTLYNEFANESPFPVSINCASASFDDVNYSSGSDHDGESSSSPNSAKKRKIQTPIDNFSYRLGEVIKKMEERVSELPPLNKETTDELFMMTMVSLMKQLPDQMKEQFQSDMFQAVMKLRSEAREISKSEHF